VQRNFAGMCFLFAAVALGVAAGSWWLQYTVFTPSTTVANTQAILSDDEIRGEITTIVAAATATSLEQSPAQVAALVNPLIASRAGASVMSEIVRDAHARVIGNHDDPVRISAEQMVLIVRDQRVADLPAVTIPVAEVAAFRVLGNSLGWVAAVIGILGFIGMLLGIATRPDQGEVAKAIGELLISMGSSLLILGFLVPVLLLPNLDDTTWARSIPRLAGRGFPIIVMASLLILILGVVLTLRSSGSGRRKQWSTPLSVSRYRDDRSWS
jgi:hypothetical protein